MKEDLPDHMRRVPWMKYHVVLEVELDFSPSALNGVPWMKYHEVKGFCKLGE